MCRALRVLCAGAGPERLVELKAATVSVHWELVGGASSNEELADQLWKVRPDVLVIDQALGERMVREAMESLPAALVVLVRSSDGRGEGVELEEVKEAILGAPPPGGPVRTPTGA